MPYIKLLNINNLIFFPAAKIHRNGAIRTDVAQFQQKSRICDLNVKMAVTLQTIRSAKPLPAHSAQAAG